MGKENFYRYSAYNNNCQTFISNILKANNLLTYELNNFIVQNTQPDRFVISRVVCFTPFSK